jgi:two-component system, cell cycle response regulator
MPHGRTRRRMLRISFLRPFVGWEMTPVEHRHVTHENLDTPSGEMSAPSVLIVEDEGIIAKDIERTLCELGYRVTGNVKTGRAALHAMEETRPSLMLSDIRIKGDLDGIELAAFARERFGVPVVFLTSHADESTLARATATDPYGYLLKPFSPRELRASLELALRRHALNEQLELRSTTDELTGLHNRRGFMTLAEQQLKVAVRTGRKALLVYADLNGMKAVNDTFGHDAGDQLLRDAARMLRLTFRDSDILARLGGDEFVVLAVETDDSAATAIEDRLQATVRKLNQEANRLHHLSVSLGVCVWDPGLHPTLQQLLADADAKMYGAKLLRRKYGSGSMPVVVSAVQRSLPAPSAPTKLVQPSLSPLKAVEHRYAVMGAQAKRVAHYSRILAERLGYAVDDAVMLGRAAALHDIGELGIPEAWFDARSELSPEQRELLRNHTRFAAAFLDSLDDAFLQRAAAIALSHHERWDGTGYPESLRGPAIPLDARIVAVAVALATAAGSAPFHEEAVIRQLRLESGRQFDPTVVEAAIAALPGLINR